MRDYIDGPLSNPTNEMLKQSRSAPINNMDSEKILGMADFHIRRSHNATIGFIDGKTKFVYNNCGKWLGDLEPSEQRRSISFAIGQGAKMKRQASEAKQILQDSISLRRERMRTERHDKQKKEKERQVQFSFNKLLMTVKFHNKCCPIN